ncbi:serine hydrolase domain-containing protein [Pseudooceanicola sp. C21-150M6]|uniref:serine hydrolase domain-containing protein n=1 Tax=Pseudooceanicola sp. C21-150M6 TaxID=3434355 RepID=UPI003D7F590D
MSPIPTAKSRRRFLATGAACALLPAALHAQGADPFAAVADRARSLDQLHTILIRQNGADVFGLTPRGPAPDRPVNVKSVSKSIIAILAGCALDRAEIPALDATLGELAPGLIPAGADPRVAGITTADLLTLRAGLARTSGPNYGSWIASPDWVADALSREMIAEPGSRMLYSTGTTHVLGALLAERAGESLLSLARTRLGDPLGVAIPPWTRDPQGRFMGGNEMALSPRALIRIGEMMRQNGTYEGTRLLSASYVAASFQPRTRSPFSGLAYGYGWFLGGQGATRYALARGYGGQIIAILPGLRATVVITSDPTRPARSQGYFGDLMQLLEGPVTAALTA